MKSMRWSLYIGQFRGIKVYIHWTFLILLSFIVVSSYKEGKETAEVAWVIGYVASVFACVTLHEFGHALTAQRYNIVTKDIVLLPIGGMARMKQLPDSASQELVVAVAGPIVNLVIAAVLFGIMTSTATPIDLKSLTTINRDTMVQNLFLVNLFLAGFNLLPAFPMDGGRIFRALLSFKMGRARATAIAAHTGQLVAIAFFILGLFFNFWLVFIGVFIFLGAGAEASLEGVRDDLHDHMVKEIARSKFTLLHADDELSVALKCLLDSQEKEFVVTDHDKPVGILTRDEMLSGLSQYGPSVKIRSVMQKDVYLVEGTDSLEKVWQKMIQEKISIAAIMNGGVVASVLNLENISEYLLINKALH